MDVSSESSMTKNLQKLLPLFSWSLIVIQDEVLMLQLMRDITSWMMMYSYFFFLFLHSDGIN
jgi:hypothetical protein